MGFRVETFIEHQDSCKARRKDSGDRLQMTLKPATFLPPQASFMKPIFNLNNLSTVMEPHLISERRTDAAAQQDLMIFPVHKGNGNLSSSHHHHHTLELRELFPSKKKEATATIDDDEDQNTLLRQVMTLRSETKELMRVAMEQKAKAAEKRKQARVLMEMANQDMEKASKIREQAFVTEIRNAQLQKDGSTWQMLISGGQHKRTCDSCKLKLSKDLQELKSSSALQVKQMVGHGLSSFPAVNYYYFPSAITHGENGDNNNSLTFRPLRHA